MRSIWVHNPESGARLVGNQYMRDRIPAAGPVNGVRYSTMHFLFDAPVPYEEYYKSSTDFDAVIGDNNYTVAVWAKMFSIKENDSIIGWTDEGGFEFLDGGAIMFVSDTVVRGHCGAPYSQADSNSIFTAGASLLDGNWHHYCLRWNASLTGDERIRLFVDGVKAGDGGDSSIGESHTNQFNLGRVGSGASTSNNTDGEATEAVVFNIGLTDAEVAELYNAGVPFDPRTHSRAANLQIYWRAESVLPDQHVKNLGIEGTPYDGTRLGLPFPTDPNLPTVVSGGVGP